MKAGHGLSVWNRTASKADPLAQIGPEVVTDKTAMAHCATVFTVVSTTDELKDILFGKTGVLAGNARPKRVVDMSSISDSGSAEIRKGLTKAGVAYLSAPVSGNAKVAKAGKLLVVAFGPCAEYDAVQPLLAALGRSAEYVGEGELSRIWKIARLNAEVKKALESPEVKERLGALGTDIASTTPSELDRIVERELKENAVLVKEAGIKVQ